MNKIVKLDFISWKASSFNWKVKALVTFKWENVFLLRNILHGDAFKNIVQYMYFVELLNEFSKQFLSF